MCGFAVFVCACVCVCGYVNAWFCVCAWTRLHSFPSISIPSLSFLFLPFHLRPFLPVHSCIVYTAPKETDASWRAACEALPTRTLEYKVKTLLVCRAPGPAVCRGRGRGKGRGRGRGVGAAGVAWPGLAWPGLAWQITSARWHAQALCKVITHL